MNFAFCPKCATALAERPLDQGKLRRACPKEGCGFVHYDNPTPVVAAVVEHEGAVLLVRAKGWPEKMFGLVAGFLERGEAPSEAVVRELKEETGLDGVVVSLIGAYPFTLMNQVIIAYHVKATGTLVLGEELLGSKYIAREKLRPWDFGTGQAVKDWLAAQAG